MKLQESGELKSVGVDIHVHTPASADYRGSRDPKEYLNIVRRANEFGSTMEAAKDKKRSKKDNKPISCVAFTDHNSVEGFRTFRLLQKETEELSKSIRGRDPGNSLVEQLENELATLRSVRVLMGVELKADPGIHLLIIFAEAVEPDDVVRFLEDAYERKYSEFAGDPTPTARWTIKVSLDKIQERFSENAFVVFPHVDSGGGVYEDLKDFAQVRITALTHPVVKALSFNKEETRDKLINLFRQPDYRRATPVAFIQSSDYHGQEGSAVGQPRTEIRVRDGKPTFKNLKEAFRESGRIKCSADLVVEEYENATRGRFVAKFIVEVGTFKFREDDLDHIAESVCGMLNTSGGGILEFEGAIDPERGAEKPIDIVREQLKSLLNERLEPSLPVPSYASLRFSPGRVRVLCRFFRADALYAANRRVYVVEGGKPMIASPGEIEYIASQNLSRRFGGRFEKTLERVSRQSTLLSVLPKGIPLLLRSERRLIFGLPASLKVSDIKPAADEGNEISEIVDDLIERTRDQYPFGDPEGNSNIIDLALPPRHKEHYLRFSVYRAKVDEQLFHKCAFMKIDKPAIVLYFGGGFGLLEPGYIISDTPAVMLEFNNEWQDKTYAILSWLKSSFFLWYCAVHLGNVNPFLNIQFRSRTIPLPRANENDFFTKADEYAKTVISGETSFMNEMLRHKKKGTLDSTFQEKERKSHNRRADQISLRIDEEVYRFLDLVDQDKKLIAATLRGLDLSDFGYGASQEEPH